MHWKCLRSLSIQWCLLLQLLFLLFLPASVTGVRIYKSRSEIFRLLGTENTNEERIYMERCVQSSSTGNCMLAIDDSIIQEWTQCASTLPETDSWWKAQLETPSYVTRLVIHTAELPDAAMLNGLNDIVILASGVVCHRHISSVSFKTRSFPCDSFADQLHVQSYRSNAVLSLCEIEVYGKPVLFQGLDSGEAEIGYQNCKQSTSVGEASCIKALDRNFELFQGVKGKMCSETLPAKKGFPAIWSLAWWSATFLTPTLVKHVKIYNRMDSCCKNSLTKFVIKINELKCATHEDKTPFLTKIFKCSRFGSLVKVESHLQKIGLRMCQVQVFGYPMILLPDTRYNYIGCYKDIPGQPDFELIASYSFMTPRKCHRMCKRLNKLYFAMQNGQVCMCGNKYGRHGKAEDETACNMPCTANIEVACGGRNVNTVYEIVL